jgi:hypothetical protein
MTREMPHDYARRFRAVTPGEFMPPARFVEAVDRTGEVPPWRDHYVKLYPRRRLLETTVDEMPWPGSREKRVPT